MGNNQGANKHLLRGDLNRPNLNNQSIHSNSTGNSITSPGGFVYPNEDLVEDFDDNLATSHFSKSSNVSFIQKLIFLYLIMQHFLESR